MKPIITQSDYRTIKSMLDDIPNHLRGRDTLTLRNEIEVAEKVKDENIKENMVRLNSTFTVEDRHTGKQLNFILTLPEHANLKERKLSVLSPLGIALLGYASGEVVEWPMPSGIKSLKIIEVIYKHMVLK